MSQGYLMEQPLVIQGPREEASGTFGNAQGLPQGLYPSSKNYASDEKTRMYFDSEIAPIMRWTRADRASMDQEMSNIRNMNSMKHDSGRRYFGRSDQYMPLYKRERAKLISTYSRGLFPSEDYFDVIDRFSGDPERSKPVKYYMQWEMDTNARLRSFMKPHLGSLVDNGTAIMKSWYKKALASEGVGRQARLNDLVKMSHGFEQVKREGIVVSPRQLLYWYIYPSTCESLDDAMMCFEDLEVPIAFIEMMKLKKRWVNVDDVIKSALQEIVPEHERAKQELLNSRGEGAQIPGRGNQQSLAGTIVTLTEVWTYMPMPEDAYLPWEDKRLPIPVLVSCLGGSGGLPTAVDIRRNPFNHQKTPYDVSRIDWEAGFFYGNAQGRIIRPLQLLVNDFVNQTNDNGIMGLNPGTIWDVNKVVGTPSSMFPGFNWFVLGNPNEAVKFDRPPIEQVQTGMAMSQFLMGIAQDAGGATPDYGQQSKASKTATGMSIAQGNNQLPLQDTVQDIETDTLIPLYNKAWRNAVQYRDASVMVSVAGEQVQIDPDMLAIEAEFRCLGATQATNKQIRVQQALSLIQAVAPIVPMIVQQGYIIDFVALIQKVWVDGLGFRGFKEFIRKAAAVPQMGMPRPDQMGGVQSEQQDNLRSAMEQVNGAFGQQAEAQPGEAQDFSAVRNQADQLAATGNGYNS